MMPEDRVLVTMSGGVDSSVAAALLKQKGYKVMGIMMKIWNGEIDSGNNPERVCFGPKDIEDARKAADKLNIPLEVIDLREEYKSKVLNYFYNEYLSGRTPTPCVVCNKRLKLGALVEKAKESGIEFDYVATGHYVRKGYDEKRKRYLLMKARDRSKDQTYFLYTLSQNQIKRCLFPIGEYTKEEVRNKARELHLPIAEKSESQDFITGDWTIFFGGSAKPGPIMDRRGKILGEHRGIQYYTIGQRRGLGVAVGKPLYVIEIQKKRNAIIVGSKEDLFGKGLIAKGMNWIAIEKLKEPIKVKAKIRAQHKEAKALVSPLAEDKVSVTFKKPQNAITPGQAVVFYDEDIVVGGGTIEKRILL
ncbi:MAG: tRNA 2-thiouridine(34) synthase MnmA [candidate division WOR-3 bacterium]|nr:tRNA 2-thiouridine(34) synthase MnmA [candidate division WOR-3 bacterium]